MKKLILFLLTFCFLLPCIKSQWIHVINGMGNQTVYSLTKAGNYLFAGTYIYGVYSSVNNGLSWTQTSLNNRSIYSLAASGSNVFAGTSSTGGVFISTNNGISWTQTSLNNQYIYSLAIGESNAVFAGTNYGLFISTNNGANWTQETFIYTIYSLAVTGSYVFAGTPLGVFLSTNNGGSWAQTSLNDRQVYSLAVNGSNVFAGTSGYGVSRTTNSGANWIQTALFNRDVYSLAVSGGSVFAGTAPQQYGVYVSSDNGLSWLQRNEGFVNVTWVYALCIHNNFIFAGTDAETERGVYRRSISEVTGIRVLNNESPGQFSLLQNYPNPFNPETNIEFAIPKASFVKLGVYDMLGREIETLVNEELNAGTYNAKWNATNYSSGVYFYKLVTEGFTETKKMMLIK